MEAVRAGWLRAGLLDGVVEADPTIAGVAVAVLAAGAVIYVALAWRRRSGRR